MFDLSTYLEAQRRRIDHFLNTWFEQAMPAGRLRDAMRYALMAGGKRLRPVLCGAAAEAVGGTCRDVLPAACALEMIHTYSLIHDDLPAMDDDALRRGKPTCHVQFDEATAVLAGDALLTMAFQLLSDPRFADPSRAPEWLAVTQRIACSAGGQGMVEGQMRDMAAQFTTLDRQALEALHALKTGALISAAVHAGALLGGGHSGQIDGLETYAAAIGLAFQVKDDILNVEGDPETTGKSVGTDEIKGKSTYPSVIGLEASKAFARDLVARALQALTPFDLRADPLRAIAAYIIERNR
ncbi:MAG: polyprenyl synthetase family protein [Desulfatitalea sp.]|nr:polyprenyl synthetase family protein [Desulfatitalea sp.]NNK00090.1 polyprenyl synthetase family protein [Desulfatitalea sp.]